MNVDPRHAVKMIGPDLPELGGSFLLLVRYVTSIAPSGKPVSIHFPSPISFSNAYRVLGALNEKQT